MGKIKDKLEETSESSEQIEEIPEVEKETPSQSFIRIANKRVDSILNKIRILGYLSNRTNYSYTIEQIDKIFDEITKLTAQVKAQFDFKVIPKSEKQKFSL
jgi:hypothetical protein